MAAVDTVQTSSRSCWQHRQGLDRWPFSGVRHGMACVRSYTKCVSRIALFAMAILLALSFSHFHAIASVAISAPELGSAPSQPFFTDNLSAQVANAQSARQPRSNRNSDELPGDICAVMATANAALFASPPALPLAQNIEILASDYQERLCSFPAFQPRASDLLRFVECS